MSLMMKSNREILKLEKIRQIKTKLLSPKMIVLSTIIVSKMKSCKILDQLLTSCSRPKIGKIMIERLN